MSPLIEGTHTKGQPNDVTVTWCKSLSKTGKIGLKTFVLNVSWFAKPHMSIDKGLKRHGFVGL